MLSKEEIEKAKEMLNKLKDYKALVRGGFVEILTEEEKEAIETLLQYIDKLEADNYACNNIINDYIENDKKQNKIIDEMIDMISSLDLTINMVAFGGQARFGSNEEIKQYFEKKVEEK